MRTGRVMYFDNERIDSWDIGCSRDDIGAEARVQKLPILYDHVLHQGEPESLHRTAFDLTFDAFGIDGFPCIRRGGQSQNGYLAGVGVDFDFGQLACPGVGRVSISLRSVAIDIGCGDIVPAVSSESFAARVRFAPTYRYC